jgi:sugar lactone lactonase YvrE
VYRIPSNGGRADVVFHRDEFRPNGIAFKGDVLYVSDPFTGEIWRADVRPDGSLGEPMLWVKDPLLNTIEGLTFDHNGTAWCVLQRNAIVTVDVSGKVREVARNDSKGPLEAPTGIVFVGPRAYANNHDTVAPPNGDGKQSDAGVGASIVMIEP